MRREGSGGSKGEGREGKQTYSHKCNTSDKPNLTLGHRSHDKANGHMIRPTFNHMIRPTFNHMIRPTVT